MIPSDRKNALRALSIASLLFLIALAISAASDEGGVAWSSRIARTLPLAPLVAALGAWLTLGSARAKTERLALESIGRSPQQNSAGAVAGGAIFALVAAALLGFCSKIDVEAIFPAFSTSPRVTWNGATFVDAQRGVTFDERGEIFVRAIANAPDVTNAANASPSERHERAAATIALSLAAIAFPLFAAACTRRVSAIVIVAIALASFLTLLAFDAAASGRAPAFVVAVPQAALLFFAVVEYRRSGWFIPSV